MPPIIALAHAVVVFLMLWTATPPVTAPVPLVTDLALVDGRQPGGGSPVGVTVAEAAPSTGDAGAAEQPAEPEPPPPPDSPPAAPDPLSDVPSQDAEPEPAEDVADNPDVVAMVEALTGVRAEAVERRPIVSVDVLLAQTLSAANVDIDGAGGCDLARRMQQGLQDAPEVTDALARLPQEGRSVANALLLWDQGWVSGETPEIEPLLEPARRVVSAVVRAAPEACRQAVVNGPRFLVVEDQGVAHVLVVGSGIWRWAQIEQSTVEPPDASPRRPWWRLGL